jgi:hypothetical protein
MIDKFLTDLAAHAGCDSVLALYHANRFDNRNPFQVSLFWDTGEGPDMVRATGPTVNDAMNAAIAAKRAREAEEAA